MSIQKAKDFVVFFDFDNTITKLDVIDDMLPKFSKDILWKDLEDLWKDGKISTWECLKGQVERIVLGRKDLDKYLEGIALDPYFKRIVQFLRRNRIRTIILSDNFDYIIRRILLHNRIRNLKVLANKIVIRQNRWIPSFPYRRKKNCPRCAHCKKGTLLVNLAHGQTSIFVGDGLSDVCGAKVANIVFAKGSLLSYCRGSNIDAHPYETLRDVYNYLKKELKRDAEN